jgi:hypothetical protein
MALFYETGTGGVLTSGESVVNPFFEIPSGGSLAGGSSRLTPYEPQIGGGALSGGSSEINPYNETSSSGAILGGSAKITPHLPIIGGGSLIKGHAEFGKENEKVIPLNYKSFNLTSGLDVRFDFYNELGTALLLNAYGAEEIDSQGVYRFDFATDSSDFYLLAIGYTADGRDKVPYMEKCGLPTETAFYTHKNFTTGLTLPYDIYDLDGVSQQSGNLTEVAAGFYSVDISTLDLEQQFIFDVGGVTEGLIGGVSAEISGGVIVGGHAAEESSAVGSGGAVIGGTASNVFDVVAEGGAIVGGVAATANIFVEIGEGGAVLGGEADEFIAVIVSGGIVLGGEADVRQPVSTFIVVPAGVLAGGVAEEELVKEFDVGIGGRFTFQHSIGDEVYYWDRHTFPHQDTQLLIVSFRVDSTGRQKYTVHTGTEYFETELIPSAQLHQNLGDFLEGIDDLEDKIDNAIDVPYAGPRTVTVENPDSDDFPLSGLSPLVTPDCPAPLGGVVSLVSEGADLRLSGISPLNPSSVPATGGTAIISGPSIDCVELSGIKELEPENIPPPSGHKILVKQ